MHKLNYKFNHKKPRYGLGYKALMEPYKEDLPTAVDLRVNQLLSPIEDQGSEGDCAAHATAGALEFLQNMALTSPSVAPSPLVYYPDGFQRVSRQQLYWCARQMEGTSGEDSGISDLNDMATVAKVIGVAREDLWPYTPADLFNPPPANVFNDAAAHKLTESYGLDAGYQLKHCLWSGFPFMLGFQVFQSFMNPDVAATGQMPMPVYGEAIEGGHAVLAVGYSDDMQCFLIRNSWGVNWGLGGYFYMPYEFMDSQYAGDFVTLRSTPTAMP
jgi:C1A family cysteine protease